MLRSSSLSSATAMLRLLRRKPYLHLPYTTATTSPTPRRQSPPLVTDPTLTLYFLQKSCKLSPAAAAAAAQKINLKSTKNAHSVLALLREYQFSDSHIARLISHRPKLLVSSPARTLKPKLDFFASIGLSAGEFTDHFCALHGPFYYSIQNRLVPNLRLLRILLPSEADLLTALRRYPSIILSDLEKFVPVQTKLLLDAGLPLDNILKLITLHPRCSAKFPNELHSCVTAAKEMGINPSHSTFVHACKVISKVPKPTWESRIQNLERLGWSRDHVYRAFARHPYLMSLSEEKVKVAVEFFGEKLGWGPERLSESPVIISHSFEKRISPRYRLVKLLVEKGLWKRGITATHFMMSEKKFLDLYVAKHQEMVPEILEALGGNFGEKKDFNFVCEKVGGDDS
ncbi:hypothetical protein KSP39_PZI001346 [Platanthera zijinensis]|uniref:Uncharacterized protein n=1 Tax=Platanthera zijinensis TaxID=2320716 RepID=A0AAP0C146_9ASPA